MGAPLVPARYLSPSTGARIAACGHAVSFVTPDGRQNGRWSCGSSWCSWCSSRRRARARGIIADVLDDDTNDEHVTMVTLTIPHECDLSAEYLTAQVARVAEVWRRTQSELRWHRRFRARGEPSNIRPPGRPRAHPVYASTYDRGWSGDADAGVWVREVTEGSSTSPGWHVHVHAVLPSRGDAELLNAAWQQVCAELGVMPAGRWTSTRFSELPSARAASYIAKYLTKGDVGHISARNQRAYVEGTKGMRRCDAWGGWRPLGLAQREPGTATGVTQEGWDCAVSLAAYYGETWLSRWLRTGIPPEWDILVEHIGALARRFRPELVTILAHDDCPPELRTESARAAMLLAREIGVAFPVDTS